ncbi:MAG: RPB7/RPC8 family DNA-directed RNA polymerase subunit [Candidatus Njordarchaeales archaeon]
MFFLTRAKITVPIEPKYLDPSKDLNNVVLDILRKTFEGTVVENIGLVIAVLGSKIGEIGRITMKKPVVYFDAETELLIFKPMRDEIVEGEILDVSQTAVYVNLGCLDAFCPLNQLSTERFRFNAREKKLRGVRSKVQISKGDWLRGRIIRFEYRVPVELQPIRRGTEFLPSQEVRPKSELRIILRGKDRGLGLLKVLVETEKEVLKLVE